MLGDKFNEMYLKLTAAKNLDKKGNTEAALKAYTSLVEEYTLQDTFAYERLCSILMQKAKYEDAKRYAAECIEKIKKEEISGNPNFFVDILKRAEERMKPGSDKGKAEKTRLTFTNGKFTVILLSVLFLLAVLLSLPDKIFKLIFILFSGLALVFVLEIIRDIQRRYDIRLKSAITVLSVIFAIYGAFNMPKSQWENFMAFTTLRDLQKTGVSETAGSDSGSDSENAVDEAKKTDEISEKNLDDLQKMANMHSELVDYKITIADGRISLAVTVSNTTTLERGKSIAESILRDLNTLKEKEAGSEEKLGGLYKEYSCDVSLKNESGTVLANADTSKATGRINWDR